MHVSSFNKILHISVTEEAEHVLTRNLLEILKEL